MADSRRCRGEQALWSPKKRDRREVKGRARLGLGMVAGLGVISMNLYEAKTQLSKLVAAVETRGELVVLCRNGMPVADIVPHEAKRGATLQPDPELLGARFLEDPTKGVSIEDWPEELR